MLSRASSDVAWGAFLFLISSFLGFFFPGGVWFLISPVACVSPPMSMLSLFNHEMPQSYSRVMRVLAVGWIGVVTCDLAACLQRLGDLHALP